jgi:hypothetical protein
MAVTGCVTLEAVVALLTVEAGPTGGAHGTPTSKEMKGVYKRKAGLAVLRTLLESGYPLFNKDIRNTDTDLEILFKAVLACVEFNRKEIYESACVVVGMLLTRISEKQKEGKGTLPPCCEELRENVRRKFDKKYFQKNGVDSIAACLCKLSSTCPDFFRRDLFMKMIINFKMLKARGRYEFLQAVVNSKELLIRLTDGGIVDNTADSSSSSKERSPSKEHAPISSYSHEVQAYLYSYTYIYIYMYLYTYLYIHIYKYS